MVKELAVNVVDHYNRCDSLPNHDLSADEFESNPDLTLPKCVFLCKDVVYYFHCDEIVVTATVFQSYVVASVCFLHRTRCDRDVES